MKNILVTGGAGFIGSNFVHHMLREHPDYRIVVYDKLTYAGNPDNLKDVEGNPRYAFVLGDICDAARVRETIEAQDIDTIVNFAAETHVDRSLSDAGSFVMTDVYGTFVLLEAAKELKLERYHQVSTDEVYGQVLEGASVETDRIETRSPYSASKAAGDLMVLAYHTSFGLPVTITRGSNSIG
ncbi:MAG: SDR family NAD(P)-dependent oxidoreductase, partial [Anaerolineae bacterium]